MSQAKYVQSRWAANSKFREGDRMTHKPTGDLYIKGLRANSRECWIMRVNPGARTAVTWKYLLENFEHA